MIRIKQKRFKFLYTSVQRDRLLIKGPVTTLNFPLPVYGLFSPSIVSSSQYINSLFQNIKLNLRSIISGSFIEIIPEGVGFRFIRYPWAPQILGLSLGYSHPSFWNLPTQCLFRCNKYRLFIFSGNRSILNEVSHHIIRLRTPDPYKAKGLKHPDDKLKLKPGKIRQR